tara:strand:- start:328 stop:453 length:126 start_codon:yes stop_codon:yes gene_type:complete
VLVRLTKVLLEALEGKVRQTLVVAVVALARLEQTLPMIQPT